VFWFHLGTNQEMGDRYPMRQFTNAI